LHSALFVSSSTFSPSANQTVTLTDRKELSDLRWHRSTARIPGPTASNRSLSTAELEWIMGRGIAEWLGWPLSE